VGSGGWVAPVAKTQQGNAPLTTQTASFALASCQEPRGGPALAFFT
jgi:hypothetical protein